MNFTNCLNLSYSPCLISIRLFSISNTLGNHYKVLNLQRNATAKEIKESFIQLSKENHPDVNKSKNAHKTFLKIHEAYKVLSKPHLRELYDLGFSDNASKGKRGNVGFYRQYYGTDSRKESSYYTNRDTYYENQPYYGIKGIKKLSNATLVFICLSLATVALVLEILTIRYSFIFKRDEMIKRSNEAHDYLMNIKENAALNGNPAQVEFLKLRMENCEEKT